MTQTSGRVWIEIDDQRFEIPDSAVAGMDIISSGPRAYHLLHAHQGYAIEVLEFDLNSRRCQLRINGEIKTARILRELEMRIESMGLADADNKRLDELKSPMPGMVTALKAEAGQSVEKGTPLLILEAMKMENVITAPQPAVIKKINVTVGQAVDKGAVLVEFSHD